MAATQSEVDTFITNIRTAVTEYGDLISRKQRLGKSGMKCDIMKLMLLSAYLDCIYDYFLQYSTNIDDGINPSSYNFFTIEEIRDVMQHINNICGTFYIIEL
jgi:hypothetical protein